MNFPLMFCQEIDSPCHYGRVVKIRSNDKTCKINICTMGCKVSLRVSKKKIPAEKPENINRFSRVEI